MPTLGEHSNVYNTALLVVRRKGFQVWYDEAGKYYGAERDGWDFFSESPAGLLGLIAIYEEKHPTEWTDYWWREQEPFILRTLPKTPQPYASVMEKH